MERIRGILFVMRGQFWLLPSLMSGASDRAEISARIQEARKTVLTAAPV